MMQASLELVEKSVTTRGTRDVAAGQGAEGGRARPPLLTLVASRDQLIRFGDIVVTLAHEPVRIVDETAYRALAVAGCRRKCAELRSSGPARVVSC